MQLLRQSWRAWLGGDETRVGPWWVSLAWAIVFGIICAIGFTVLNVALNADNDDVQLSHLPVWSATT